MTLEPMPLFWLLITLLAYLGSRWLYRRTGRYLLSPLILVPAVLLAIAVPLHTAYAEYARNTHWLMTVLGPVTVAFAVPIWQQRALLARHWPALTLGMLMGSAASIGSSWGLAHLLALDSSVSLSLVPRSITTPFCHAAGQGPGRCAGAHRRIRDVYRCIGGDVGWRAAQVPAAAHAIGPWRAVWCRRSRRGRQPRP